MTKITPNILTSNAGLLGLACIGLLGGCSGYLNERAGLRSDSDLPALQADRPSLLADEPSVNGHDRTHWPQSRVVLTRDNITHHPTYVGQPAPAFSTLTMAGDHPTASTALDPARDPDFAGLSGLHESALFALDVIVAPFRMIQDRGPQSLHQSPGSGFARIPGEQPIGVEDAILMSPWQRSLDVNGENTQSTGTPAPDEASQP